MKSGLKAVVQGAFGRLPGGPGLYRHLMGTESSHVDKLSHARVFSSDRKVKLSASCAQNRS